MTRIDNLPSHKYIVVLRRSGENDSGASLESQANEVKPIQERLESEFDGDEIKTFRDTESGADVTRETLDEILKMAKRDEFDVLVLMAIHRLTRDDPLLSACYLQDLREEGVHIYSARNGYYNWDKTEDQRDLLRKIADARVWLDTLNAGAARGMRTYLKKGRYAYGDTPYGTENVPTEDGDEKIVIKDGYKWALRKIHELYLEEKNMRKVTDRLSALIEDLAKYAGDDDSIPEAPSYSQLRTALGHKIFTGKLEVSRTGEVVKEKEDLRIIDESEREEILEIRNGRAPNTGDDAPPVPDFAFECAARYGPGFVAEQFDGLAWICPECNSLDINVRSAFAEYYQIKLPRIHCSDCGYDGPAIKKKELDQIDTSLPLTCPACQQVGDFETESVEIHGEERYEYTCEHDGVSMILDMEPNTVRRAINHPMISLNLRDSEIGQDGIDALHRLGPPSSNSRNRNDGDVKDPNTDDDSPTQTTLSRF